MPDQPESTGSGAKDAAFALAFSNRRSPLPYELHTNEELLPWIRECAPAASTGECLEALTLIRSLCGVVYDVCEAFRAGRFGPGADAASHATDELSRKQPGFAKKEYQEAFAAGMLWTAF